jgi:hypothetical protein
MSSILITYTSMVSSLLMHRYISSKLKKRLNNTVRFVTTKNQVLLNGFSPKGCPLITCLKTPNLSTVALLFVSAAP